MKHTLGLLRPQFNSTNLHLDGVKVGTMTMSIITNITFLIMRTSCCPRGRW